MGWNCPKWMGRLSSLLLSTPTPHGTKSTRSFSVFPLLLCDWNVKKSSLDSYNCVFSAAAFRWWCPEVARSPSRRLTTSGNGKKRALISYSMMRGGRRCRRACWLQTRYLIYSSTAKSRDKKTQGRYLPTAIHQAIPHSSFGQHPMCRLTSQEPTSYVHEHCSHLLNFNMLHS